MGGKGSGGARIGAGRKPKRIERRGGRREGAGRKKGMGLIGDKPRVTLGARVAPETIESLVEIEREENVSRGIAIDRAVRHYTEHKKEKT